MARYIDADKLKERLKIISVVADDLYEMGINRGLDRAETEIDMLPEADVVEVVRCKDCTEWDSNECECSHWYGFRENDFCSYGERRTEDETI